MEYKFEIDQRVKVRDFMEMYAEYGCDEDGDIPLPEKIPYVYGLEPVCFTQSMKYLCGMETTIIGFTNISVDRPDQYVDTDNDALELWWITPSMLQPVDGVSE